MVRVCSMAATLAVCSFMMLASVESAPAPFLLKKFKKLKLAKKIAPKVGLVAIGGLGGYGLKKGIQSKYSGGFGGIGQSFYNSFQPSYQPSYQPTYQPTYQPYYQPTYQPTYQPYYQPSYQPAYSAPSYSYQKEVYAPQFLSTLRSVATDLGGVLSGKLIKGGENLGLFTDKYFREDASSGAQASSSFSPSPASIPSYSAPEEPIYSYSAPVASIPSFSTPQISSDSYSPPSDSYSAPVVSVDSFSPPHIDSGVYFSDPQTSSHFVTSSNSGQVFHDDGFAQDDIISSSHIGSGSAQFQGFVQDGSSSFGSSSGALSPVYGAPASVGSSFGALSPVYGAPDSVVSSYSRL